MLINNSHLDTVEYGETVVSAQGVDLPVQLDHTRGRPVLQQEEVCNFKVLYRRPRESTVALATEEAKAPPRYKILIEVLPGPQRIISQVYK